MQCFLTSTFHVTHIYSHKTNPLIHYGQHFGCSVHAFCHVQTLLVKGIVWEGTLVKETHIELSLKSVFSWSLFKVLFSSEASNQREQQEWKMYRQLLDMVPKLKEHIMGDNSDEDLLHVTELVGLFSLCEACVSEFIMFDRFKKKVWVLEPIIQRVWKVPSWIGLLCKESLWDHHWHATINQTEDSTIRELDFCCAPQSTIGMTKSNYFHNQHKPFNIFAPL